MNIGIDIDDTINNLNEILFLEALKYNKEKNITFNVRKDKWEFEEAFGWNNENIEEFLSEYIRKCFINAKPKDNVSEIINKLKKDGNKIIIITSRSKEHIKDVYKISKDWLHKNNIPFDKIITSSKMKSDDCLENEIDVFIDDVPYFCEKVKENTDAEVLLMDSPYNKKYENDEFERVHSWKEIYEKISIKIAL